MKEYFVKHKITLIYSILGAVILLCTGIHLYTNKTVTLNQGFSLIKASYMVTVEYSASSDVYLEGYYTGDGQEFVLFGTVIPATDSLSNYSFPLEIKHSIRNDSICIRTPQNAITEYEINKIKLTSNIPWVALVTLVAYAVFAILYHLYSDKIESKFPQSKLYFFLTCIAIFLEPLFLENPVLIVAYYLAVTIFVILLCRGRIVISQNLSVYGGLLLFSFLLMEFFTTSSPLYPLNTGCDSNVYYTVGSAVAHGRNLYSEVFDHKGPALLFLFTLGYILSPTTFWGVWVLEVIALSLDMFFIYKICMRFLSNTVSVLVSMLTPFFVLTNSTLTSGATCEEFLLPLMLGAFAVVLPYVSVSEAENDIGETDDTKTWRIFIVLGVLSALVFFSKFNLSAMWVVIAFILWLRLIKKKPIRNASAYCGGWLIVAIPIAIYFLCTDGLRTLYHYYIRYNLGYSGINSIRIALAGTLVRVYETLTEHYFNALFILVGIAVICVSKKYLDIWGKIILVVSFVVLCGTTYAGLTVCGYYYTLPAVFAFIGYAVVMSQFSHKIEASNKSFFPIGLCMVLVLMGTFYINSFITASILANPEPRVQEVFSQQMELRSRDGNATVFELGFLESGFIPVSGRYPTVQYFYLPNSIGVEGSEPYAGQIDYLNNASTEFFVWAGCGAEDYPQAEGIAANYNYICTYRTKNDVFYMLYQRKN